MSPDTRVGWWYRVISVPGIEFDFPALSPCIVARCASMSLILGRMSQRSLLVLIVCRYGLIGIDCR